MMEINPNNSMFKKKRKVSEISADTEGDMKEFLLGLKNKIDNEDEQEEKRHKKPEFPESFAQSKKSVFSEVTFELDSTGLNHITSA